MPIPNYYHLGNSHKPPHGMLSVIAELQIPRPANIYWIAR